MAIFRSPIQREPAEGLLGRVAVKPTAKTVKPAPAAPKSVAPAVVAQAPEAASFAQFSRYLAEQQASNDLNQNRWDVTGSPKSLYNNELAAFNAAIGKWVQTGGNINSEDFVKGFVQSGLKIPKEYWESDTGSGYNDGLLRAGPYSISEGALGNKGETIASGYTIEVDGQPFVYSYDAQGNLINKLKSEVVKTPDYWYQKHSVFDPQGNPIREFDGKKFTGGSSFGDFLKTVAPIALSAFGAPYLAGALGGGLGATIGAGAITGAAGSAITGGNILKGAALGGIGGGIGYGVNNSGLLGGAGDAASAGGGLETVSGYNPNGFGAPPNLGGLPADLASSPFKGITGFNPEGFSGGMSAVSVGSGLTSLGGPPDMTAVGKPGLLDAPPVAPPAVAAQDPTYPTVTNNSPFKDIQGYNNDAFGGTPKPTSIGGDLPTTPDAFGPGFGNLAPGNGITTLGGPVAPPEPSIEGMIEQAKAAGKSVADWAKANPLYARAAMMAGGALLNTVGGKSDSGGSGYKDDGYRPTISRGGFQASIAAPGTAPGSSGMAPGGAFSGVTLPSTGQANDGLWRYGGNRPGGLLPGLASAMPRPPQTGLIANYNPTGGMREMVPTNSPQPGYGYDDPVVNGPQLTAEQQRLMSPLLGLLNTNPTRGWM